MIISRKVGLPALPAFKAVGLQVFVPRQTTYPAVFVASFHQQVKGYPAGTGTMLLLFERPTASDRWSATYWTYQRHGDAGPHFAVGKDGYIPVFSPYGLAATPRVLKKKWVGVEYEAVHGLPVSNSVDEKPRACRLHPRWGPIPGARDCPQCDLGRTLGHTLRFGGGWRVLLPFYAKEFHLVMHTGWHLRVSTPEQRYYRGGDPSGDYSVISQYSELEVGAFVPKPQSGQRFQLMSIAGGPTPWD